GGVKYLAPLPPVIANGLIIGWLLTEVYQVGVSFAIAALYVAAGEALACYGLGIPLLLILEKNGNRLFPGR
ncbi:MAG: QueT transporter family protein, partial [Eubacteriales bacterium]|nr:QueT transporter family protein [Eubacteriales bacterium]